MSLKDVTSPRSAAVKRKPPTERMSGDLPGKTAGKKKRTREAAATMTHKNTYSGSAKPYENLERKIGTDLIGKSVGYGRDNDNRKKKPRPK